VERHGSKSSRAESPSVPLPGSRGFSPSSSPSLYRSAVAGSTYSRASGRRSWRGRLSSSTVCSIVIRWPTSSRAACG
jgi:hypothetical protein